MRQINSQEVEAELLVALKRAQVTFVGNSDRCSARDDRNFRECMARSALNYEKALRAFSDLTLKGKMPKKDRSRALKSTERFGGHRIVDPERRRNVRSARRIPRASASRHL